MDETRITDNMRTGGIIRNPPKIRASAPTASVKLQVMRDTIPFSPIETTGPRYDRGFTNVTTTGDGGFQDVQPGWYVGPIRQVKPVVPTENDGMKTGLDYTVSHGILVDDQGRIVRTIEMGDQPLPIMPPAPPTPPKSITRKSSANPLETKNEDQRKAARVPSSEIAAYAKAKYGYTGKIDSRMRTLILDCMADEISIAAYTGNRNQSGL